MLPSDRASSPTAQDASALPLPIVVRQLGFTPGTKAAPSPDYNVFTPRADIEPYTLTLPVAWSADPFHDRNWCAQLHMFRMTEGHLIAFEKTGDARFLRWPLELLLDWRQFHIVNKKKNKYAWADKVTGHRAATLAYIMGAAQVRQGIATHEEQEVLRTLAEEHVRQILHVIPVRLTNHTFDDLVVVRALAEVLPGQDRPEIHAFVKKTLQALLRSQFTDDGLHKENSPGYQVYASMKLRQLMAARWFEEYQDIAGLLKKSEAIERWFRTPDNRIVMVGDTNGHVSGPPSAEAPRETGLFQTGGYVIRRDRDATAAAAAAAHPATLADTNALPADGADADTSDEDMAEEAMADANPAGSGTAAAAATSPALTEAIPPNAYFLLMGSAQSAVHKHNDDLSYVWYDGVEIVRETGKFAYKTDPMRTYAISARAHNTIELDGRDPWPPLTEPYPPYGNAIRKVDERDGCTLICASVRQTRLGIIHARTVLYRPGHFVLTVDLVRDITARNAAPDAPDDTGKDAGTDAASKTGSQPGDAVAAPGSATRPLIQWTHFATDIKLRPKGNMLFEARLSDGRQLAVGLASDQPNASAEVIRGQTEPRIQGWTSTAYAKMTRNDALGLTHQHAGLTHMASLVAIDGRIRKLTWTTNERLRVVLDDEIITITPHGGRREASWRIDPTV